MFANVYDIGVSSSCRAYAPTRSLRRRSVTTVVNGPGLDDSVSPFSRDGRHPLAPIVRHGEVIGGRYRIEEVIGEGGMGLVAAARHLELGHRVAVKFLRAGVAGREDGVARFRWEARASLQIRSEHVVRVTDAGTLRDGAPYMVMELLAGIDLGALLKRRGPLPVEEAIDYVLQGCEALAEAHRLGICHCQVKSPRIHRPDLPEGLERVILRCLDKDRDSRIQDVLELAEALLPFAAPYSQQSVARITGAAGLANAA